MEDKLTFFSFKEQLIRLERELAVDQLVGIEPARGSACGLQEDLG